MCNTSVYTIHLVATYLAKYLELHEAQPLRHLLVACHLEAGWNEKLPLCKNDCEAFLKKRNSRQHVKNVKILERENETTAEFCEMLEKIFVGSKVLSLPRNCCFSYFL